MYPDDFVFSSGNAANTVSKCSSPELDSDSISARETPDGMASADIPLVKYVKWNVPTGEAAIGETEGQFPIRRAVAKEILPDTETMKLKKSIAPTHRRRSSRKLSLEIGAAVDLSSAPMSDSELENKSKWQPSSRCSPVSVETFSERPDIEPICALSVFCRESYTYAELEDSANLDHESERLKREGQTMRRSNGDLAPRAPHQGCHRISDIAEAVRDRTARASTEFAALKILSRGVPSGRTGAYDDPKAFGEGRGLTVSPLPSASQLRAAKAAQHSYDSDSETVDSVSMLESGYSDMMGVCTHQEMVDCWAREAAENPYSTCEEIEPRFKWLRRSVGPITALAGAFLVFYGPRVMKCRRWQN